MSALNPHRRLAPHHQVRPVLGPPTTHSLPVKRYSAAYTLDDINDMAVMDPAQEDPLMRAIPLMSDLDNVLLENLTQATRMRDMGTTAKVS